MQAKKNEKLNWKKIDENWRIFTEDNHLFDISEENNYFYGKQEIYAAKEDYQGFQIFYKNKLIKSATPTPFTNRANSFYVKVPITTDSFWTLKIKATAFWKRIFNSKEKLKINTSLKKIEEVIPLKSIELLTKEFPDLVISIGNEIKNQTKEIQSNTELIEIITNIQPVDLNQLNIIRILTHRIIENLSKKEKIKPAHNNG